MFRNILEWPHPKLRNPSESVDDFSSVQGVVGDLIDTLNVAGGVGLAAPQIGVSKKVFVVNFGSLPYKTISPSEKDASYGVFINPTLVCSGPTKKCQEACLSVPFVSAMTPRSMETHITWNDEAGEKHETILTGYLAQIFQHENDHLDGKIYLQRLSPCMRTRLMEKVRKKRKKILREEKRKERANDAFRS